MAFKLTQQVKLGQRLVLTQQMRQMLQILQLPLIELHDRVQQALESNIMLETDPDADRPLFEDAERGGAGAETQNHDDDDVPPQATGTNATDMDMEAIPDQLPIDSDWRDIYDDTPGRFFTEDWLQNVPADSSLKSHLLDQVKFLNVDEEDNDIACAIIDAIDEKGYLRADVTDIIAAVDSRPALKRVEKVLRRVQEFDPAGVAARTLEECLSLQLEGREDVPARLKDVARRILHSHIELLAEDQAPEQLQTRLCCDRETVIRAIAVIRDLDPHPGAAWADGSDSRNMIPEVFVKQKNNRWVVQLNPEAAPRIRVNSTYKNMIRRNDRSEHQESLRSHLREARWLIGALKSRAQILLKTAICIVRHQEKFLQDGEQYMKPLRLRQIAEELQVHESTVSRAIAGKSMHTPQGVYELIFFFPSRLQATTGETSSVAAKSIIKKLINGEPVARPLSDDALSKELDKLGIKVARRTVAKYREALNIPSRHHRRRRANTTNS